MSQPFPNLQSQVADKNGNLTPIWRNFFATMWNRTGGSVSATYALLNGSENQVFNVAAATSPFEAVNLSQYRTQDGQNSAAITLTGSPFSYTATGNGTMVISGNGVASLSVKRGTNTISVGAHYAPVPLRNGDVLTVNYIGTPVLTWVPN